MIRRLPFFTLLAFILAPALAGAQAPPPPPPADAPLSPPPLVEAVPDALDVPPPPPPLPRGVEPPRARPPGAPQTGYPYSPAAPQEPPGPEIGLMFSESIFGMLTAAGVTLLPYFLFIRQLEIAAYNGGTGSGGIDPAVGTVIFILLFSAVPLATSQTVVSLANGSRNYQVDSWPAALVGLGVEAAAIALYFIVRSIPDSNPRANPLYGVTANEWMLLINTVVLMPLSQVLISNLLKKPKISAPRAGAALNFSSKKGLHAGLPIPAPVLGRVAGVERVGLMFPLFSGVM